MSRIFTNEEGEFICECGKVFHKSQSFYAHQGHCKIHLGDRYSESRHGDRFGDSRAWLRGLTKETDPRVKAMAENLLGREGGFKGHHHTEEFKAKMSKIARYNAKNHLNGWKAGSSKVPNKYELFTEEFLISKGVEFSREVTISQSSLGNKGGSYYQLDFLINNCIDLEIDGSSHNDKHDAERDHYVTKQYRVYRIKHNDSIDHLKSELTKFINTL